MQKEDLRNLTLTGPTEGKKKIGKRELCKGMAEQGFGGILKGAKITSSYEGLNDVESHDHSNPEEEKKNEIKKYISTCQI